MGLERALHWRTHTKRGRILIPQCGEFELDGLQLAEKPVVVGIRHCGTVEHVVLVLRTGQQFA